MPVYDYYLTEGARRWAFNACYKGHRKHRMGFLTKDEAQEAEDDFRNLVRAGVRGGSRLTFKAYSAWWLEQKKGLKPSTLATYKSLIAGYNEKVGLYRLSDLRPAQLSQLIPDASPKTRLNHIALLRSMFSDAVKYEYVRDNPADKLMRPKVEKDEMRYLTATEAKKLMGAAEGQTRLIVSLAILTGMRMGEIYGLRWEDVGRGEINVRRSLYRGEEVTPKSYNAKRKIPIGKGLSGLLEGSGGHGRVISGDPDNFRRREFVPLLEGLGLEGVRFHDLRHTFAALNISMGVNPKHLQRIMGHGDFKTTMDTYGHLYPEDHSRAANALEKKVGFTVHTREGMRAKKQVGK